VAPHERGDGLTDVVLRAGDYIRHVDERLADESLWWRAGAGAE